MRLILALITLPFPTLAWEFSPDPLCTLRHVEGGTEIVLTYDPRGPEYTISVTTDAFVWPDGIFFMGFEGPQPLTISTDRHTITEDGSTLSVRDSGFGNVLNGLEFNTAAYAGVGQSSVAVSLEGISDPIRAFRACPSDVPATS